MAMKAALDEIKMPVERAKNRLLLANDIQVGVPVFCHKTDEVDSKYRVGTITFTKSLSLADMGAELVSLNFYGDPADLEEPDDDLFLRATVLNVSASSWEAVLGSWFKAWLRGSSEKVERPTEIKKQRYGSAPCLY
eukprot:5809121-Amphidinium_carterae.1